MTAITVQANKLSLEIDRALSELNVSPETPVILEIIDGSIKATPVKVGIEQRELSQIVDELDQQYGSVFTDLAR